MESKELKNGPVISARSGTALGLARAHLHGTVTRDAWEDADLSSDTGKTYTAPANKTAGGGLATSRCR